MGLSAGDSSRRRPDPTPPASLPGTAAGAPIFHAEMQKIPGALDLAEVALRMPTGKFGLASCSRGASPRGTRIALHRTGDTARFLLPVSTFPGTRTMSIYVPCSPPLPAMLVPRTPPRDRR